VTAPETAVLPGPVSVKVDEVIVAGFIAWLKVAVMAEAIATPVAPLAGVTDVTVGGTGAAAVVNVHASFDASAVPDESVAPVVIVAVYCVLYARFADGVNVATDPLAAYVTVPETAALPGPVSVKVAEVIVAAFIAWLKVAVRAVFTATPVVPLPGVTEVTVGGVVDNPVPEPEFEPPQPATPRTVNANRQAIPKRMMRFLLGLSLAKRTAGPTHNRE
jgi:energy-converting hydrogenase Eha subunit B